MNQRLAGNVEKIGVVERVRQMKEKALKNAHRDNFQAKFGLPALEFVFHSASITTNSHTEWCIFTDFSCASRTLGRGHLYITKSFICFETLSLINSKTATIIFPIKMIQSMQKAHISRRHAQYH